MAIRTGYNGQVSSGLVFAFDTADFFNSYRGEPTYNRLDAPEVNGYPTTGNWWGTYNTNKYCGNNGCAVHWDIPSIASVSSNIITTNGSHGIYSFDVITPQTTGGGVTAGVNYLARKISDTQFSLHEYNGSQGGDQGYINPATRGHKVHDSFWLDQRISVSSSGFPTRWWGPPHLPNSGLVKEIIVGGFDRFPSQKTDCMRLHAHRPESADGMAYSANATVVPGQVHTYSFWTRALNQQTANGGGSMSNYNYGNQTSPTSWGHGYTHGPLGVWTRQSFQFTPINEYVISYYWPNALDKYDLANIQVERNSKATPFVAGTRSNTGALLDIAGGATLDLTNVSFDSNSEPIFDGTNDFISVSLPSSISVYCLEMVWYNNNAIPNNDSAIGGPSTYQTPIEFNGTGQGVHLGAWTGGFTNEAIHIWGSGGATANQVYAGVGYHHVVFNWNGTTYDIWVDGVNTATQYLSGNNPATLLTASSIKIGNDVSNYAFNGKIPITKIYNRSLTSLEVSQNFNSYKKRFNL